MGRDLPVSVLPYPAAAITSRRPSPFHPRPYCHQRKRNPFWGNSLHRITETTSHPPWTFSEGPYAGS